MCRRAAICVSSIPPFPPNCQGAYLSPERTLLVSEYMEGGDLLHNIAAGRVTWYRRGRKVRCLASSMHNHVRSVTLMEAWV